MSLIRLLSIIVFLAASCSNRFHFKRGVVCSAASYIFLLPLLIQYSWPLHFICLLCTTTCPHLGRDAQGVSDGDEGSARQPPATRPTWPPSLARKEPQIEQGSKCEVPADDQCLYHCIAAALNVAHYKSLTLEKKVEAAYYIKGLFIQFLRSKDLPSTAARLSIRGVEGHPTEDDLAHVAAFLGEDQAIEMTIEGRDEMGPIHYGSVGAAPSFRIFWSEKPDGDEPQHFSGHYELQQSWLRLEKLPYEEDRSALPVCENQPRLEQRLTNHNVAKESGRFKQMREMSKLAIGVMQQHTAMEDAEDFSLLGTVKKLWMEVDKVESYRGWSDHKKRLAVATLALSKMKPAQLGLTDHLKLLWIFLGDQFIRSHDGHLYFYEHSLGWWAPYQGLLPFHHFEYMRGICLQLEGLLRGLSRKLGRDDADILAALAIILGKDQSEEQLAAEILDNAMTCKGNDLLARQRRAKKGKGGKAKGAGKAGPADGGAGAGGFPAVGDGEDGADDDEAFVPDLWYLHLAQNITRTCTRLQSELMSSTKTLALLAE